MVLITHKHLDVRKNYIFFRTFCVCLLKQMKKLHYIHTKNNYYEDNYNSIDNYNVYYY